MTTSGCRKSGQSRDPSGILAIQSDCQLRQLTMSTHPNPEHSLSLNSSPFHKHPSREHARSPVRDIHVSHEKATSSAVAPEDLIHRQRTTSTFDEEIQRSPVYTSENDPYQLSSRIKSPSEINLITANTTRKRDSFNPLVLVGQRSPSKLTGFYESQNANIERLLKPVNEHVRQAKDNNAANQLKFKIAVYGSFVANVILAILQLYGALSSGSLSL